MDKQGFLTRLEQGLSGLPQEDISERLAFYEEMIDDRVEEGLSEESAVLEIGPVDAIIPQIVGEIPISRLFKERVKTKRGMQVWEIVLLVLGSPVWLSLLVAAFAVVLSVYVVVWSVILSLWAVDLSFAVGALGGMAAGVFLLCRGDVLPGVFVIGAGLVLAGLSVFLFFGCRGATAGALILTKKIAVGIKKLMLRKEQ